MTFTENLSRSVVEVSTCIMLDEPGGLWSLTGGDADLFSICVGNADDKDNAQPHVFIGRVGPNSLLAGHSPGVETLLVRTSPGATLRRLGDPSEFGSAHIFIEALHIWADFLVHAVGESLRRPANIDLVLQPGSPVQCPANCSARVRGADVWVRAPSGGIRLMGWQPIGGLIPLHANAWVCVERDLELGVVRGSEITDLNAAVAGVHALTAACISILPLLRNSAEENEVIRLQLRARHADEAVFQLTRQAEHLSGPRAESGHGQVLNASEPLLAAMTLVARVAGLRARVQRPQRAREEDLIVEAAPEEIARTSNLRMRPVTLPGDWWQHDFGPLLGRMNANGSDPLTAYEPVALVRHPSGYHVVGANRAPQAVTEALAGAISSRAWSLFDPLPDQPLSAIALGSLNPVRGADLWIIVAASAIGGLLGLGLPAATSLATSSFIPAGDLPGLFEVSCILGGIALANFVVQMVSEIVRHRIIANAEAPLFAGVWDRLLRLPLSTLRKFDSSELWSKASMSLAMPLASRNFHTASIGYGATLIAAMIAMAAYDGPAMIASIFVLVAQASVPMVAGVVRSLAYKGSDAQSVRADSIAVEAIDGIAKLRLAGAEGRLLARWSERFLAMREHKLSLGHIDTWQASFSAIMSFAGMAVLFFMFAGGFGAPTNPSVVAGFMMAYLVASNAVGGFANGFASYYPMYAMRDVMVPLLLTSPEPVVGRQDPGQLSGRIDIQNVFFGYESAEKPVFRSLNLSIAAGEFIAVTGRSGSGKSTLVRLLLGLETLGIGTLSYDRRDIHSLDLGLLRRRIGTVLQNAQLPPGPILDIVRGFTDASEPTVWQALSDAAIADDIRALPLGIRTTITDATRTLSGGQIQRLLLARALVTRPDILILDEATSALDSATQAATMRTLEALSCTRIMIAHRLETIRQADRVVVIEGGKVAHSGRYEDLVANGVLGHA